MTPGRFLSSLINRMRGVSRHQVRNIIRVIRRRPLVMPSLVSMTLEYDDVALVRHLRRNRALWYDDNVVRAYEHTFARWNGSRYAFAFMGGRVALSACIHALGLGPGDEVIIPGFTCVVVPNAFAYAGVKVICADIELETYGLDVEAVARAITPKTRAVMLHHLFGLVCRDYNALLELAADHGLYVIEDCAHSTGTEYRGRKIGNLGHVAFFSSEHSKIFNTGQGGLAVTNNPEFARRLENFVMSAPFPDKNWIDRQLTSLIYDFYKWKHPRRWITGDIADVLYGSKVLISTTTEEERGIMPAHYGRRMPAAIALIGSNQLRKVDRFNAVRRKNAELWSSWCDRNGIQKPRVVVDSLPVYLRYPIMVSAEMKQDTRWAREQLGLEPGVWFLSNYHPVPIMLSNCPNAEKAVACCINLPTLPSPNYAAQVGGCGANH